MRTPTATKSEPTLAERLQAASDKGLLTTYAALTHRMHDARDDRDLRARRNAVEAEVLRRMGGAR